MQTSFATLLRGGSTQGNGDIAQEVISLPGGDLFVAGTVDSNADGSEKQHGLARYKKDGCPVTTFGTGGITATGDYFTDGGQTTVVAAARQSNGKIVVVGGPEATIARYNDDGSYDDTFGDDGMISYATAPFPTDPEPDDEFLKRSDLRVADVAIDEYDGGRRIVIVGSVTREFYTYDSTWGWLAQGNPNTDIAVIVLQESGTPDPTFTGGLGLHVQGRNGNVAAGSSGSGVVLDYTKNDLGRGVAIDADRKIVIVARTIHKEGDTESPSNQDFAVFRMTSGNALDGAWSSGGFETLHMSDFDEPDSVVIQSNGRIVIGGTYRTASATNNFMLAGFTPDTGVLDTTFSGDGIVEGDHHGTGGASKAQATSLSLMPDDKIVIGGYTLSNNFSTHDEFALSYYQANGTTLSGGRVQPRDSGPYPWERSYGATALADGRVVMVGGSGSAAGDTLPLVGSKFHLVRLQGETPVASPALTLGDATVPEGNSGTTSVNVPVTLSTASTCDVTFSYETDTNSASSDDFTHATGTHTIPAGTTNSTIPVSAVGDTVDENNEVFLLRASNIQYARAVDTQSEITITDNDGPPPPNTAPTIDPISNKQVAEGQLLTFQVTGGDADDDPLTFGFDTDDLPESASMTDGDFSWRPGYDEAGSYEVMFWVSDGVADPVSTTATITVTNAKRPTTTTATIRKTQDFIKVNGEVNPDNPGDEMAIKLFKKKAGKWKQIGTTKSPSLKDNSTYATKFSRPGGGSYKVTAKYLGDIDHKASSVKKTFNL